MKIENKIIGALDFASRSLSEIPGKVRLLFESFAQRLAGVVTRLRMGEELLTQTELLQETNAAMRALLRQREVDRAELEQTIMDNVRELVLPYVEKLQKSRPSEHQGLYIDLLASHLKEITTPLARRSKISTMLTLAEIRVAELIRYGKTTKEIAEALGTSEGTVQFHRKSIRRKLDLSHKKINLRSYLSDPKKW